VGKQLVRLGEWFLSPLGEPSTVFRVVWWWEVRRVPFNILVGVYGFVCLFVFYAAIETSGHLKPGEDAVEPMAIFLAPFVINAFYTLGWLVEVPARLARAARVEELGPTLLALGLAVTLLFITLPAAFWGGFRLLQLVGLEQ
jgi:hypothetical protein